MSRLGVTAWLSFQAAVAAPAPLVRVDGSSTVYPIAEAAAEDFQASVGGRIWVTVGVSGTGGGFRRFCRGDIDVVNASRPIRLAEMRACEAAGIGFIELPLALDALTVVVHPSNPADSISIDELRRVWAPEAQSTMLNWRQIDARFPNRRLNLYGPGTDSGTFEYFTEAIVGKPRASRADFSSSEDDHLLAQGVARDPGGMAYVGLAYFQANRDKLKALAIAAGGGERAYAPTPENVIEGRYRPLSRPIFAYVSVAALQRPEVASFADFLLRRAAALVREVNYVPLRLADYAWISTRLRERRSGSAFGGQSAFGRSAADPLGQHLMH